MKCFMHPDKEASSVCKRCGKAMCIDCSSYTNHSGICPACKKVEYEIKLAENINYLKKNKNLIILWSIIGVLITTLSIFLTIKMWFGAVFFLIPIVAIFKIVSSSKKCKILKANINYLTNEINKINNALSKGTGVI